MTLSDTEYGRLRRILDETMVDVHRLMQKGLSKETAAIVRAELLEAAASRSSSKVAERLNKTVTHIRNNRLVLHAPQPWPPSSRDT